ncbi:MAG: membrane protein insertase YidC [Desulfobulbaceae bacterium A2]|nr:MAG: membrane protein insertase YidC [Desulfobulbaceae bacterium A2]
MDMQRTLLAVALSFLILIGYQYFFAPAPQAPPQPQQQAQQPTAQATDGKQAPAASAPVAAAVTGIQAPRMEPGQTARDIVVETPLYRAVVTEAGGGFKSFTLKKYYRENDGAQPMELVRTDNPGEYPALFTPDLTSPLLPLYQAAQQQLTVDTSGAQTLTMTGASGNVQVQRSMVFKADSYLVDLVIQLTNGGVEPLRMTPALHLTSRPFTANVSSSMYVFQGPAALLQNELLEIKDDDLAKGPRVLQGALSWVGYEDTYFLNALIPGDAQPRSATITAAGDKRVSTLAEAPLSLAPGDTVRLSYQLYFGPKKLDALKEAGHDLHRAVDFGWFDVVAKPMLALLNLLYGLFGNYGVAIILVTVVVKLLFWPITHKGMKSMKNMQKLQPKMAKIREKYKNDPAMMNQELMAMYKTYKVNPLGGCLPMLLQIPVFFALYKVLLVAIELRHAPFLLWINDLSAPDRLHIGIDIPYLGGIPVMTLLMGASMFLQQKMTPTTLDPTQAKIMMFLPVVFTFMFINFSSGLVLYWFVNNLLSILQQQIINRQTAEPAGRRNDT